MRSHHTPGRVGAPPGPGGQRRCGPRPGRAAVWVVVALAVVIVAVATAAHLVAQRPTVLSRAEGTIRQVVATPTGVYWIEHRLGRRGSDASRLLFLDRVGAEPRELARGQSFVSLAVADNDLFALDAGPEAPSVHNPHPGGRLLQLPRSGGPPIVRAEGLSNPQHLWVDASDVCWTETYPPLAPAVTHVPALGPIALLRALSRRGSAPRLVARLEGTGTTFAGEILGRRAGEICWLEPHYGHGETGVTLLRTCPSAGGIPRTLWLAETRAHGAMLGSAIYTTDVSTEASPASDYRSVHRHGANGTELLTDWLLPGGWLLPWNGSVFYVGRHLWRIPAAQDWPEEVVSDTRRPRAAGVAGGFFYAAMPQARSVDPAMPPPDDPERAGGSGGPGGPPAGSKGGPPPGMAGSKSGARRQAPPPSMMPPPDAPPRDQLVRWPLTWQARLRSLLRLW